MATPDIPTYQKIVASISKLRVEHEMLVAVLKEISFCKCIECKVRAEEALKKVKL